MSHSVLVIVYECAVEGKVWVRAELEGYTNLHCINRTPLHNCAIENLGHVVAGTSVTRFLEIVV